jgi:hypothetical protein
VRPSLVDERTLNSAFPDNEDFGRVLRSLSRTRPDDMSGFDEDVGAPESVSEDRSRDYPELRLYAAPSGKVTLAWLIGAVTRVLAKADHPAPRITAGMVLALYLFRPDRASQPVQALRRLLQQLTECDLNQYYLLRVPAPPNVDAKFGPFSIGPTPEARLRYQCERAGSDYYERYGVQHRGRLCVARDPRTIRILPVNARDFGVVPRSESEAMVVYSLADRYFGEVGREVFEKFMEELRAAQAIAVGLGGSYFDPRLINQLGSLATALNVYLKLGSGGWVAPKGQAWLLNINPRELQRIGALPDDLPQVCPDGVFTARLQAFGSMLVRAVEHENDGRLDEAFLHRVIALDSVLGETASTTEAVATRGAVLLTSAFGEKLRDRKGLLKSIYDVRSRYVHDGRPCDQQLFDRLKALCPLIARALFRLTHLPHGEQPKGVEQWHEMLDVAYGALGSGIRLAEGELQRMGVEERGFRTG